MAGAPGGTSPTRVLWREATMAGRDHPAAAGHRQAADAAAPTVTISAATNGFRQDIGPFMLLGLELPDEGCWELTGHYAGRSLHFVVRVR